MWSFNNRHPHSPYLFILFYHHRPHSSIFLQKIKELLTFTVKRIHTEKPVEGTPSTDSDLFMYHRGDNDAANPLFLQQGDLDRRPFTLIFISSVPPGRCNDVIGRKRDNLQLHALIALFHLTSSLFLKIHICRLVIAIGRRG